jgi:hypothetical protein
METWFKQSSGQREFGRTVRNEGRSVPDSRPFLSGIFRCRLPTRSFDPSAAEGTGGWLELDGGGNWSGGNRELPKVERGGIGSVRSGRFSTLDRGKKMTLQPPVTQTAVSEINASREIESRWHAARHPENAKNQKNPENDTGVHLWGPGWAVEGDWCSHPGGYSGNRRGVRPVP